MAEQLESGVLVTYEGEGHGTYGGKSTCVDSIVVDYLVNGTVPADGVRCSAPIASGSSALDGRRSGCRRRSAGRGCPYSCASAGRPAAPP